MTRPPAAQMIMMGKVNTGRMNLILLWRCHWSGRHEQAPRYWHRKNMGFSYYTLIFSTASSIVEASVASAPANGSKYGRPSGLETSRTKAVSEYLEQADQEMTNWFETLRANLFSLGDGCADKGVER